MQRRVRVMVGAAAIAAGVAGACADEERRPGRAVSDSVASEVEALDPSLASRLPQGSSLAEAEEGRKLYPPCAVCHGLDARGTQLGPDLRDGEWIQTSGELEEIVELIRAGVPEPSEYPVPMPVMGGGEFTEEQLRALATYVYLLSREGEAAADG